MKDRPLEPKYTSNGMFISQGWKIWGHTLFSLSVISLRLRKPWAFNLVLLFICPSSDGTYYGMVMSVRPSVRPSVHPGLRPSVTVFQIFLLHALTYWAEILHVTFFLWTFDQVRVSSISVNFRRSYAPFGT